MISRIFSTLALWALIFGTLWFFRTSGGLVLITGISVLTLREFYRLMAAAGWAPFSGLGMFFGGLITLAPYIEARFGAPAHPLLALAAVIIAIRVVIERSPEKRVEALASTLFGLVYVALLLQYMVRILTPLPTDTVSADGRLLLCLWLIAVAKFCDVGALLTGLAIGKHKMAPQISPKKTWEGAVGGVLTSIGIGALVAWLGRHELGASLTPLQAALIAGPIAVIAIMSDLIESVIKRRAALKDSGHVIPGIGGMFDLSDSLLLTAPVAYFLFRLP
ncbi:MAG: phosphatidate cytidylyltransferase [Opitutaceae bacterium]